jgi:hypothetical protein
VSTRSDLRILKIGLQIKPGQIIFTSRRIDWGSKRSGGIIERGVAVGSSPSDIPKATSLKKLTSGSRSNDCTKQG